MIELSLTEDDIAILTEAIYQKYGYDFRQYSKAHLARRLTNRMILGGIRNFSDFSDKVIGDPQFAAILLQDLSITVTEMFRDPDFFRAIRNTVIPVLRTYSFIKVWHAGCSTGEEVYSMAIILKEEGLYDRSTIYATDFNQQALDRAKEGIFTNDILRNYTVNYQRAGGTNSFSDHYTSHYNRSIMSASLKKNIVWANHNLVTDVDFAEVHLILCRNVLIYFQKNLQERVQKLFYNSLIGGGFLCLGSKESLCFSEFSDRYTEIDKKQRIFKKKYD